MIHPTPNQNIFVPQISYDPVDLSYPIWALPPTIREAVKEVQVAMKAPMPLVASSILGAVSLVCQNVADVQLPFGSISPSSLFFITLAESGERKSSVDALFMRGIEKFEARLREDHKIFKEIYDAEIRVWQLQIKALEKNIAKSTQDQTPTLVNMLSELMRNKPICPQSPQLIAKDVTPEALASKLRNWPTMGLMSNEAGVILNGRVAEQLPMLNTLWDGATYSVTRKNNESFILSGVRLTASLMLQEKTFQKFLTSRGSLARDNGFLARCLITRPVSMQGIRWVTSLEEINLPALEIFENRIFEILNSQTEEKRHTLELSLDAKNAWKDFSNYVESNLCINGMFQHVKDAASKMPENATRMAALFHSMEKKEGPVSFESLIGAIEICKWHLFEFKKVFDPTPEVPQFQQDAILLDNWLREKFNRHNLNWYMKNFIRQSGPNALRNKHRLDNALEFLEMYNVTWRSQAHGSHKTVIHFNPQSLPLIRPHGM